MSRMSRATRVAVAVAMAAIMVAAAAGPVLAVDAPNWVAALYVQAQSMVGLRWMPVAGATGYKVLRSTTPGAGYQEIATTTAPQHFDKEIEPGNEYYYVLQAVAGAEVSANSGEKGVVIPGEKKKQAVTPPEWKNVTLTQSTEFGKVNFKVGVFWVPSSNPDVVAYNLYRSTTSGKDFQLLTSSTEDQFVDNAVEEGKTYYYVLTALDNAFQETPYSEERSVEVKRKVEAKKKKEKGADMVTRPTKDIYRLDVKNYPADLQLLPYGQLGVAASFLLFFDDPDDTEAVARDISEGWNDFAGVGVSIDDELLAISMSKGIRIYSDKGILKKEILLTGYPNEGTVKWGDKEFKLRGSNFVDVAQDSDGNFYVTENVNHRILKFDENGDYLTSIGEGQEWGRISSPTHIRIDKEDRKYVNSFGASAYFVFGPDDAMLYKVGTIGAQVGTFGKIQGSAFDGEGNFWVADMQNGNVQVFDKDGKYLFMLSDEQEKGNFHVTLVSGIAVTEDGKRLYAAESMNKTIAVLDILETKVPAKEE